MDVALKCCITVGDRAVRSLQGRPRVGCKQSKVAALPGLAGGGGVLRLAWSLLPLGLRSGSFCLFIYNCCYFCCYFSHHLPSLKTCVAPPLPSFFSFLSILVLLLFHCSLLFFSVSISPSAFPPARPSSALPSDSEKASTTICFSFFIFVFFPALNL